MTCSTCSNCSGTGKLNHFSHVADGVCFVCKGTGQAPKVTSQNRPFYLHFEGTDARQLVFARSEEMALTNWSYDSRSKNYKVVRIEGISRKTAYTGK